MEGRSIFYPIACFKTGTNISKILPNKTFGFHPQAHQNKKPLPLQIGVFIIINNSFNLAGHYIKF